MRCCLPLSLWSYDAVINERVNNNKHQSRTSWIEKIQMDGALKSKQQDMIRLTSSDFALSVRSWGQQVFVGLGLEKWKGKS
jgi:hypothetical protein